MLSRKITITLNCCHASWLLLALGLTLMIREAFGPWGGHHLGWAGLACTLVGKHTLNRAMLVQLEHEVEDAADREIEALGHLQAGISVPAPRSPLQPVP